MFTVTPASAGGWLAFAADSRLLLVATVDDVDATWRAIGATDGFQAALDQLTSKGLTATPEFVLVDWAADGTARVVVRGETQVTVTDASGAQELSAAGVSTWVERSLTSVSAVQFAVLGATAAPSVALPLESGVSFVAAIGTLGAPVASPSPGPAKVEKPIDIDVEATVRPTPEPVEAVVAPAEDDASDQFGVTQFRPPEAEEPEPEKPVVDDVLHDGETVMTSDVSRRRGKRAPRTAEPPRPPVAQQVVLVLPTGVREPLTQPILIGRNPSVSKVSGGQMPRLLTVGTADQDISRNHAQFVLEGGTVVVTDLHSRNGTSVVMPGKSPQKLRAGEPTSVIVGTIVDLGGGIVITVDEDQ